MPTLSPAPSLTLSPVSTTRDNLNHRPFSYDLLSVPRRFTITGLREFVMEAADSSPAPRVCVYTIALLPDVKEEDFEKHIREDVLPHFELTFRPVGIFQLVHYFQKRTSQDRADCYVWQIRIVKSNLVLSATEDSMLAELDSRVREGLVSFGTPISRGILREIEVIQT